MPEPTSRVPPADFSTLVTMFSTQAMVAMGAIPHPSSGKAEVQLELARHFIDLLGVVEEKTKGNLSADETNLISSSLHYLRMSFIEQSKKPAAAESSQETSQEKVSAEQSE